MKTSKSITWNRVFGSFAPVQILRTKVFTAGANMLRLLPQDLTKFDNCHNDSLCCQSVRCEDIIPTRNPVRICHDGCTCIPRACNNQGGVIESATALVIETPCGINLDTENITSRRKSTRLLTWGSCCCSDTLVSTPAIR